MAELKVGCKGRGCVLGELTWKVSAEIVVHNVQDVFYRTRRTRQGERGKHFHLTSFADGILPMTGVV